jgi:signal transduction histidine kinase
MKIPVTRRLQLLGVALAVLALLIVWSAFMSWRAITSLAGRFATGQAASYRIADGLQSEALELSADLLRFHSSDRPEDLRHFEEGSRRLNAWITEQRGALTTAKEKGLLDEIQASFDAFRAASAEIVQTGSLEPLTQVDASEARLIQLGLQLAYAHREALHITVASAEGSLTRLQVIIFAAQLALVLLAAGAAVVTSREMIAPLRVELVESQALVARSEKLASLGVLAAGVAHEIRNPLTAIKARLFMQQKALTPGSRERGDAEFIGREIDRLDKIVNDFLRFARPVEPERKPLSPAELLHELCELMAPKLREAGIELGVDRRIDTTINADPEQLKQVLLNLINNAADALGDGGTIQMRAVAGVVTLGGRPREAVILEVQDNGPGIPAAVQERLFDPFFTTKPSGTGLGLSIAARIVEKHGGALRFQTGTRGTTFAIVLPVA